MDIKRPEKSKLKKRIRAAILIVISLAAIGGIAYGLTKLKPAAPTIDRSTTVIDSVKRGQMLLQVHGNGTLVAQDVRLIPAPAEGRVEKVLKEAGVQVNSDTVIVEHSNPQMEQQAIDADLQLKAGEANQVNLCVHLESEKVTQETAIASANADLSQAKLQLDTDETLGTQGLPPELTLKLERVHMQDLANRVNAQQKGVTISAQSAKAQLNAQQATIDQLRVLAKLKHDQVEALKVRAGTSGVLQQVSVEVGQQVNAGFNLARVANPASLKAELKIAETQIKDVGVGQSVEIDTRNGLIAARVSRIDPAAKEGTFVVDAVLVGPLPTSARVDLSVDGTIELARLDNVLYVGRPAFGQGQSTVGMFRIAPSGLEAARTPVVFGRSSVNAIEIINGLREGDQVILSDTSAWDNYNRIAFRMSGELNSNSNLGN
jgi:HlyD family secretion protein